MRSWDDEIYEDEPEVLTRRGICEKCFNEACVKEQWGWPVVSKDFNVSAVNKWPGCKPMCDKHYQEVKRIVEIITCLTQ